MYQRANVAIPRKSTFHQTKRRLLIQNLKRVIRNFSGRNLVLAASSMYRSGQQPAGLQFLESPFLAYLFFLIHRRGDLQRALGKNSIG